MATCFSSDSLRVGARRVSPPLKISIQPFVRVQLRAVIRQVEHLDLLHVVFQPVFDSTGMVHFEVVKDENHVTVSILDHAFEEIDQNIRIHRTLENFPTYLALVGHRRHDAQALIFAVETHLLHLSLRGIASTAQIT